MSAPGVMILPISLNRLLGGVHMAWLSFARVCEGLRWWWGLAAHDCTHSAATSRTSLH